MTLGLLVAVSSAKEAQRPNVLFIFSDDQSVRTVSCYPEAAYPWVSTPNIDRLAKTGVRFNQVYMAPYCVPSHFKAMADWAMISNGKCECVAYADEANTEEIFDLSSDPEELVNLAPQAGNEGLVGRLRKLAACELRRTQSGFDSGHFIDFFTLLRDLQL